MLASRRGFAIAGTTGSALAMLAACSNSHGRGDARPSASALPSNQQEGAPYPADMEHLDQILSLKGGQTLPEGAHVVSVKPAPNFARVFPGGWGYVIAFTATDSSIRAYVTERTGNPGELIERYPTALKVEGGLEDIDLSEISDPWNCGLGRANVLLERPLGRGWLVIQGGSR